MKIDVLTLFPRMFDAVFGESIIKRAINSRRVSITVHDIRDYTKDKHRKADERSFGGGPGMVLSPQPVFDAVTDIKKQNQSAEVILMSPQGEVFTDAIARHLSTTKGIIIISGHYEGIDERIRCIVDKEVSIGNYVLTGGELPAMVVIDATVRFVPGVLGDSESCKDESFSCGLLEYPHYTRPAVFNKMKVPDVLLSGDHNRISAWRRKQSILLTMQKRPDLIKNIKQIEME